MNTNNVDLLEIDNVFAIFEIGLSSIGKRKEAPKKGFESEIKKLINSLEKIQFEIAENKRESIDRVLRSAIINSPNPKSICKFINNKAEKLWKKLNEISSIVNLQNITNEADIIFELELMFHSLFFNALIISNEYDRSFIYNPNFQVIGNLEELFKNESFNDFKAHFQYNKSFELENGLFAYTPQVAYLLSANFHTIDKHTGKPLFKYDSELLLNSFKMGYNKGIEFFKENYSNVKDYANAILHNYNSFTDDFVLEGWKDVKRINPVKNFNSKQAYKYGYYSGLVFMAEKAFSEYAIYFESTDNSEVQQPQPIVKQKPELNGKLITFKNNETIEKIHSELKGYFPNKESELLKALQGEQLSEILLYPSNGSSFVEVFKRLRYNGLLISTPTEIKGWICSNFNFVKTQGAKKTIEDFKENSVWDVLTKTKCEPSRKNRICTPNWLPFIPQKTRQRETENEKL